MYFSRIRIRGGQGLGVRRGVEGKVALQDFGHECARFTKVGLTCPFRRSEEDDDDEPDEKAVRELQDAQEKFDEREIPFAVPARKTRDPENRMGAISQFAVAPVELREQLERMAAFQREGGLQSVPRFPPLRATPDFPFQGRGHPGLVSILAALAVMQGLRLARSGKLRTGLQQVKASEMRAAQGLSKAVRSVKSGGFARGRGGLHVNAALDLRNLIGVRRKLGGFIQNPHTIGGGLPGI